MTRQQTTLQTEMAEHHMKIESNLSQLDKKLIAALESAKTESSNKTCILL